MEFSKMFSAVKGYTGAFPAIDVIIQMGIGNQGANFSSLDHTVEVAKMGHAQSQKFIVRVKRVGGIGCW